MKIEVNYLYQFDFWEKKVIEYKIIRDTPKTIWVEPKPRHYNSIHKSEIGLEYFLSYESALKWGISREFASSWKHLVRNLELTEKLKRVCENHNTFYMRI